MDMNVMKGIFA